MFLGKRKLKKSNPARMYCGLCNSWFGFNAGSALGASGIAVQALGTTTVAAAAGWLGILDKTWTQTQR
jgi:Amt family ammonium transporter